MPAPPTEANWSGNHVYHAVKVHRHSSLDQVQQLVASAQSIRALGSRHAFTSIGDAEELASLSDLPNEIAVDRAAGTVSVAGGETFAQLAEVLNREGLALHNLASLPQISVAGAVVTASHGSGDQNGNLATAVTGVELVAGDGELVRARHRGVFRSATCGRPPASDPRRRPGPLYRTARGARSMVRAPAPLSQRLHSSSGEEIQSEFFVAREHAMAAIDTLRSLAAQIRPLLMVSELRTIAADDLWLSPQYRRPSVGFTSHGGDLSVRSRACYTRSRRRLPPSLPDRTGPSCSRRERTRSRLATST